MAEADGANEDADAAVRTGTAHSGIADTVPETSPTYAA